MNWFKKHKVLTVIGVLVLVAIIGGAAGGGKKSDTATTTKPAQTTTTQTADTTQTTPKVTLQEFYDKIQNGQTKDEVIAESGGRQPKSCSESQSDYIGKTEYCNFGDFSDKGIISVVFSDGKVSSKSKSDF